MRLRDWTGESDSGRFPCNVRNQYVCEVCETIWSDEWSCACDDDCPDCGATMSPESSDVTPIQCEACGEELSPEAASTWSQLQCGACAFWNFRPGCGPSAA